MKFRQISSILLSFGILNRYNRFQHLILPLGDIFGKELLSSTENNFGIESSEIFRNGSGSSPMEMWSLEVDDNVYRLMWPQFMC